MKGICPNNLVFEVHFVQRPKYDGSLLILSREWSVGLGLEIEIIADSRSNASGNPILRGCHPLTSSTVFLLSLILSIL